MICDGYRDETVVPFEFLFWIFVFLKTFLRSNLENSFETFVSFGIYFFKSLSDYYYT